MKKLKLIFIFLLFFTLTGCFSVSMDLTINNDDSGTIKYVAACQKEVCNSTTEGGSLPINEEGLKKFEGAEIKDITFTKNDAEYQGIQVEVPFKSLKGFNDIMASLNEDEEITEGSTAQTMKAQRTGSKVSLSMPADKEYYENIQSNIQFIDYTISIKIEGKVLNSNADEYKKKEKTLTWKATTILKDGITLEYETSKTLFTPLNIVIGVGIIFIVVIGIGLLATRKSKKPTLSEPTEQLSVQEEIGPTTPTNQPEQPLDPITPENEEPTTDSNDNNQ